MRRPSPIPARRPIWSARRTWRSSTPAPTTPAHLEALIAAIAGRPVTAIVITHHHRDHSPDRARSPPPPRADRRAAPVFVSEDGPRADAAFDRDYAPTRVLAEGDTVAGDGWTLEAIATPGHTSNHVAFALPETQALFSGDHVMGWSTSVVSPPDGDMTAYMASLEKLIGRADRVYYPGHGDLIDKPQRLVRGLLGHRKQREGQILRLLDTGPQAIPALTAKMYGGLDPRLLPAAERSVLAHLFDLRGRGMVMEEDGRWARTQVAS